MEISKVLNHTSLQNTQIYARLNMAPVKAALNKHADMLLGMGGASVMEPAPPLTTRAHIAPPPSREDERDMWPG